MLLAGFVAGLFATGGQSVCMPWHRCFTVRRSAQQVWERRGGRASGGYERSVTGRENAALGTGTVGVMAASAPGILVAAWQCLF